MFCPECRRHFLAEDAAVCPYCGLAIAAGVVKSSAILIAAGDTHEVFRSVDEVPEELRTRLVRTTSSPQARTIIIADRRLKARFQASAAAAAARASATPEPGSRETGQRGAPIPASPRSPAALAVWLSLAVVTGASIVLLTAHLLR